jgi:hypothetical protein
MTPPRIAPRPGLAGFRALAIISSSDVRAAGISGDIIKGWEQGASPPAFDGPSIGAEGYSALALSPNGQRIGFGTSAGDSGALTWDAAVPPSLFARGSAVTAVALSDSAFVSASQNGAGSEISLQSPAVKSGPPILGVYPAQRAQVDWPVSTIAIDAAGELVAVGLPQGGFGLIPGSTMNIAKVQVDGMGDPDALAISPNGRWIAVAVDEQLSLRDISTGRLLAHVDAGRPIRALAINAEANQVGALTDLSVVVWPIEAQEPNANVQQRQPQRPSNAAQEPRYDANTVETPQREPTAPPACVDIVDIRKLGSAKESPGQLCRNEKFDGYFSVGGNGYCYRGDLDACRRQVRPPATAP